MKHRIPLCMLIAFSFAWCPLNAQTEAEPNNSPSVANVATLNSNASGAIDVPGDVDWWAINTNADGAVNISLNSTANTYVVAELYDALGTIMLAQVVTNSSDFLSLDGLAQGTFYVKIHTYYSTDIATYNFSNTLTPASVANDAEPDSIRANALTLPLNGSVTGHIGYYFNNKRDTTDEYKITTNADGALTLNLNPINATYLTVTLYDNDGVTLLGSEIVNSPQAFTTDGLAAGTYYVTVAAYYNNQFSAYNLSNNLTTPAQANDAEPNGNRATALVLPLNGSVTGHVGYYYNNRRDTTDEYKITTNADGALTLNLNPINATYLTVTLYDNDGVTQLGSEFVNGPQAFTTDGLAAGTYYVTVAAYYNNQFSTYNLSNTLTTPAQANDAEPNGNRATATTLALNTNVTGHIGYYYNNRRDTTDEYKITTSADGALTLNVNPINATYLIVTLYDNDGVTQLGSANVNGPQQFTTDGLAAGTYYMTITSYYNNQFAPYTLSASLTTYPYAGDAASEPNDAPSQAKTMAPNSTVTGDVNFYYNNARDMQDWWQLNYTGTGNLDFTFNLATTIVAGDIPYVFFSVYSDPTAAPIVSNYYNSSSNDISLSGLLPGTYWIKVVPYYNSQFDSYSIKNSFTATVATTTINSLNSSSSNPTNASSLSYNAVFSTPVTGVTTSNFSLTTTGSISGATVTSVSGQGTNTITVVVNTGTGVGNITLNLDNANGITPGINTSLPFAGQTVTVDKTAPAIIIGSPSVTCTNTGPVSFTVTYNDAANISLGVSDIQLSTINTAEVGSISVTGSGNTRMVQFSSLSGSGSISFSILANTATDDAGNTASASGPSATVQVGSSDVSIVTPPANQSVCAGGAVTFMVTASNATGYQWSNSSGQITGATNSSYTTGVADSYSVTVSGGCGGSVVSGPATLQVNPLPTVIAGSYGPSCTNSPLIPLAGSPSGGTWSGTGVSGTPGSYSFDPSVGTQTPTYTYSDVNTCQNSDHTTITVNNVPTGTISGNTAVCVNAASPAILFTGTGGTGPYSFTYSVFDGSTTSTPPTLSGNPSTSISAPTNVVGTYTYTLLNVSGAGSCEKEISGQSVTITVNPLPNATITSASMVTALSINNTASVAASDASATYVWQITNGSITGGNGTNSISYTAGASGSVGLLVSVTSGNNCGPVTGSLQVPITAMPCPEPGIKTSLVVCSGSTLNAASVASAGTGAKYIWTITNGTITSGAGTQSITYTANSVGSNPNFGSNDFVRLSVKVTNGNGTCTVSSGTYFIYISPVPNATITTAASVCTSSTGNTAWVPYAGISASYLWTVTNGTIVSGNGTNKIVYHAGTSGTVTLAVNVKNIAGCKSSSANKQILIAAYPVTAITTNSSVCAGSTGNVATVANAGAGAHYTWSVSNGSITSGTGTNSIVYTAGSGTALTISVTVTNSGGCSASSGKKSITLTPLAIATISAASFVCPGSTGNVASVPVGAQSYSWSIVNGTIQSGKVSQMISYTAGTSGKVTISVTVTNSKGCKSTCSRTIAINNGNIPLFAAIGTLCLNSTAPVLPARSTNGIVGSWSPSAISTNSTGTRTYKFTPAAGQCASSLSISITVSTCSKKSAAVIEPLNEAKAIADTSDAVVSTNSIDALAYPNPSVAGFNLRLRSSTNEIVEIVVMDIVGHTLYHTRVSGTGTYSFGSNFTSGTYFVEVLSKNGVRVLKVVKQ